MRGTRAKPGSRHRSRGKSVSVAPTRSAARRSGIRGLGSVRKVLCSRVGRVLVRRVLVGRVHALGVCGEGAHQRSACKEGRLLAAWRVSEKCPFRQSAPDGRRRSVRRRPHRGPWGAAHNGGGWGSPTEGGGNAAARLYSHVRTHAYVLMRPYSHVRSRAPARSHAPALARPYSHVRSRAPVVGHPYSRVCTHMYVLTTPSWPLLLDLSTGCHGGSVAIMHIRPSGHATLPGPLFKRK